MSVSIEGDRITGEAVRNQNVAAVMAVANAVRTSLGPIGLDKMLVDDVGEITITNDGATILRLMDTEHPASKIICDLARIQDQEAGDGTTSVVIIASELIKHACEIIKSGLHPTQVISGYRIACREACRYIEKHAKTQLPAEILINVAKTSITSKIIGTSSEYFGKLIVEACLSLDQKCNIRDLKILKLHGSRMEDTRFIRGFALNCTLASDLMPHKIENAKIGFIDFGFMKAKMALGIQVLIDDPEKLDDIRREEFEIVLRRIKCVLKSGANVVLCTGGIDDLCLKSFIEAKCMAVRRVSKRDLKILANMTGGVVCSTLSDIDGGETFDPTFLGTADVVEQIRISDYEIITISGSNMKGGSFIVRGANDYLCEEVERSLVDALNAVSHVIRSGSVVPGGGAIEAALSVHLENFACGITTNEQISIAEFANSLLIIPKTLAVNAALDASDCVAALRAKHAKTYNTQNPDISFGLDLLTGNIINNIEAGVLEPTPSKIKMLKFATEAAITILRIDDMIKLAPEPKEPRPGDECH